MKRWLSLPVALALLWQVGTAVAHTGAEDEFDETQGHPLRIVAYIVHPAGFAVEWLFLRPLHYVVSRPGLDKVFGHRPHGEDRAY